MFLHLVIAQRLARLEGQEDCASLVLAQKDGRRAAASGGRDFKEIPALHPGEEFIRPWIDSTSP